MGEFFAGLGAASPGHVVAVKNRTTGWSVGPRPSASSTTATGAWASASTTHWLKPHSPTRDLMRRRRHKETVKAYLTDESVEPVPLRRLTDRYPDTASRVIRAALG